MQILNQDQVLELLHGISPAIKSRIDQKAKETYATLEAAFPYDKRFKQAEIIYDLQGTTAGIAVISECKIRLNKDLLSNPQHTEDIINQTLPHEICHIVQYQLHPRSKAHGWEWMQLMLILNLEPRRCHNYDTQKKFTKERPFQYKCDCRIHMVTKTLDDRMHRGKRYRCNHCGTQLRKDY